MDLDRLPRRLLFLALPAMLATTSACIPDVVPSPSASPRCASLDKGCGSDGKDDCCADDGVGGGQFDRLNEMGLHAAVDPFVLDRYEVTVGRFRAFVQDYPLAKPRAGDGQNPTIGAKSGWDSRWDDQLPADMGELSDKLACDQTYATWTPDADQNEFKPINCVSWYLAFAFCAWDGGFLPTATEWNFAAAGGNAQNLYPWGQDGLDDNHAVYGLVCDTMKCVIPRVGSKPAGKGRYGQYDLAGSMSEWTLDYYYDKNSMTTGCDDKCAELKDSGQGRDVRGGDFSHDGSEVTSIYHVGQLPEQRQTIIGFRCARAPSAASR